MKRGAGRSRGYTIVEVMIFLAVSGFLFLIAATFINGKQANAEFTQSVHNVADQMQTVLTNVINGYYPYPSSQSFSCTHGPSFTGTASKQGANGECVFIGSVVQLGVRSSDISGSAGDGYAIYPVVGNRLKSGSTDLATSFADAMPTPLYPTQTSGHVNAVDTGKFGYGTYVSKMFIKQSLQPDVNISAFGVFSQLGSYSDSGVLNSSGEDINLTTVPTGIVHPSPPVSYTSPNGYIVSPRMNTVATDITHITEQDFLGSDQSIVICLRGGNGSPASITLGSAAHHLAATLALGNDIPSECLS